MSQIASKATICLCMIVKNEAKVIERCLHSVRPFISHWVIVDTGSTDGTQEIIRNYLKDVPGELYERPWQDFAHNRSEALFLARPHADYSLIIDADDALEVPTHFQMPLLTADSYMLEIRDPPLIYWRKQLVHNRHEWFYRGVLHEFITSNQPHQTEILPIGMRRNHDGARRKDPSWFQKDIETLERALKIETDAYLNSRYCFYLAQSYRDAAQPAKALSRYLERTKLGGWPEEIYVSFYQAGKLMDKLGYPPAQILRTFASATQTIPHRVEARHAEAKICRLHEDYRKGYEIAKEGLGKKLPPDSLFAEPWIYDTGLLDEFAVNAYWAGQAGESLDACLKLIEGGKLAEPDKTRVTANLRAAWEVVRQPSQPKSLGSLAAEAFLNQYALKSARPLQSKINNYPRILIAILAKQKETALPYYLECIENLDYPKSSIVLYIRTNNNTDKTEDILRDWLTLNAKNYAHTEFIYEDVPQPVQNYAEHEWNQMRFDVLGAIRNESLRKTKEYACDFYFVCDVDNFIRPETLRELVALNLPITAPFLRSLAAERYYSNYHAEIDSNGYYVDCDQYMWILNRWVRGIFEVPLVHCTYLVRADIIDQLTYQDQSGRYEYVIFSDSARKASIPQYIDNRQVYGYISFAEGNAGYIENGIEKARELMTLWDGIFDDGDNYQP